MVFCCRGHRKCSTYIKVDSLHDYSSYVISTLEGGFDIFTQCESLADIMLVKGAFWDTQGNLLHEF